MLIGAGSATDQVSLAARCALRARALLPHELVALLTGRAIHTGRLPVGEVLDRAAAMLESVDVKAVFTGKGGEGILIDEATRSLLDARFEVAEGEGGKYLLLSEREISEEARTLLGKPTPFVGRERELRNVTGAVDESFEDRSARAILVTAPAGMGKSRLRHELVVRLRENYPDILLICGRGDWIGAGSAFSMLGGALRAALGIEAGEAIELKRRKILDAASACEAASVGADGGMQTRVAEFLGELMGVPFPDDESPRLRAARQNASIRANRIREAFVDFMRAAASARPVLWVLEDLHWGDAPSVKLLDAALRDLKDLPLVVLAFARPEVLEVFPKLWGDRALYSIHLGPLSRRAAESLVKAALGSAAPPLRIAAILDRAEGNAFFLEELIRAVAEGHGEELPETVIGMVEARIAALPSGARRLLRAASVFGQIFWRNGVLALLGQGATSPVLNDSFQELVDRELLIPRLDRRFTDEDEFTFRHALVRQAAYEMLPERDKILGHKLAGQWLERAGEQDVMVLAKHFDQGGDPPRAAFYYLQAAEQALMSGDLAAVEPRVESGLACGAEGETKAALHSVLAGAHLYKDEFSKAIGLAESAIALTAPGSLTYRRSLTNALGSALMLGALDTLKRLAPALLTLEPSTETAGITARAFSTVVTALGIAGARDEAAKYIARMDEVIAPDCDGDPFAAGWVAHTRAFWARFVDQSPYQALQHDLASVHHLEEAGARLFVPFATAHAGLDYLLLGAYEAAEGALNRALAADEGGGLVERLATYFKCRMLLDSRRLEEALALATSVRDTARAAGDRVLGPNASLTVIEARIQQGLLDEAEREAGALGDPALLSLSFRPSLLLLLAELRLRRGEAPEALRLLDEARAAVEASGGTASVRQDKIALLYAEALHATGSFEAAQGELRRLLEDLLARAARIDDSELRRSFLENVPPHARTLELARAWLTLTDSAQPDNSVEFTP
jgi:tetratricopeptide (TPR) repeat protein